MKVTILNTSIITAHGTYEYESITLDQAKELVSTEDGFQSAIGHESSAGIISTLLDIDCPMNRIMYQQQPGETAVVFKLNGRPPEGVILSKEEIEKIGFSWGKLTRTK